MAISLFLISFRYISDTFGYDRCCHVSTTDNDLWVPDSRFGVYSVIGQAGDDLPCCSSATEVDGPLCPTPANGSGLIPRHALRRTASITTRLTPRASCSQSLAFINRGQDIASPNFFRLFRSSRGRAKRCQRCSRFFGLCEDPDNSSPEAPRLRTRSVRFASIFRKCDLEIQRCFCAGIMICRGPGRFALPYRTRIACGILSKDIITNHHGPVS